MKVWLLSILISLPVWALDEATVIKSVLENFPLITAEEYKSEAAKGERIEAEGSFDHVIKAKSKLWRQDPYDNDYYEAYIEKQTTVGGMKLMAGHRRGIGDFNYYALDQQTSKAGQVYAGIITPLLRNLETDEFRTKLEISKLKENIAKEKVKVKKLVYLHKALSLYYRWLLESKKLEIAKELLTLAQNRQSFIEKKFKAGSESQIRLIENTRIINKRQAEVNKAESELIKVATELSLYVRTSDGKPIKISPAQNPDKKLKELTTKIFNSLDKNPQLKILSLEQQILEKEKKYNEQRKLPGLNLDVTGFREMSNRRNYQNSILQVGVFLDIPLENRKAEGASVSSVYKAKALEKEITFLKEQLEQQFDFSFRAGLLAKERWEVASQEYKTSIQLVEGEKTKWLQGSSNLFTVNLREQDLAEVNIRLWSSLYEFHQYRLDSGLFTASLINFN